MAKKWLIALLIVTPIVWLIFFQETDESRIKSHLNEIIELTTVEEPLSKAEILSRIVDLKNLVHKSIILKWSDHINEKVLSRNFEELKSGILIASNIVTKSKPEISSLKILKLEENYYVAILALTGQLKLKQEEEVIESQSFSAFFYKHDDKFKLYHLVSIVKDWQLEWENHDLKLKNE